MCIDDQMLSSYFDGELSEPYKSQVEEHLSYCQACRERLNDFGLLSERIKEAKVDEDVLNRSKEKIFSHLEEKCFNSEKKRSFIRKKIELPLSSLVATAASVVFIFISSFIFFGSNASQTEQILPSFSVPVDSQNVQYVSQRTKESLDQYSLEEILEYLYSRGYDVDISLRSERRGDL